MFKTKTWASKNKKFFGGNEYRPLSRAEYGWLCVIAGATGLLILIRLYQWLDYLAR